MLNQFCALGSGWGRSLEGRQEEIPLPYGWTEPLWDNFERLEAAWEYEGTPPPYYEVSGGQVNETEQDTWAGQSLGN